MINLLWGVIGRNIRLTFPIFIFLLFIDVPALCSTSLRWKYAICYVGVYWIRRFEFLKSNPGFMINYLKNINILDKVKIELAEKNILVKKG